MTLINPLRRILMFVRRFCAISGFFFALMSPACLYIAPIEEDPEQEDTLPYISALSGVS